MILQGRKKGFTKPEINLYEVLDNMAIPYKKQVPLENMTIADAFIPFSKTVIYVDGEYWHSLPKVKERDQRITNNLKYKGYNVIRMIA